MVRTFRDQATQTISPIHSGLPISKGILIGIGRSLTAPLLPHEPTDSRRMTAVSGEPICPGLLGARGGHPDLYSGSLLSPYLPSAEFRQAVNSDLSLCSQFLSHVKSRGTWGTSQSKIQNIPHVNAGFMKRTPLADGGLHGHVPTRPGCTTPRIRFLFVDESVPRFCSFFMPRRRVEERRAALWRRRVPRHLHRR